MSFKLLLQAFLPALDLRSETDLEDEEPVVVEARPERVEDGDARRRSFERRMRRRRRAERMRRASRKRPRSPLALW
jgi:hypothetical protein